MDKCMNPVLKYNKQQKQQKQQRRKEAHEKQRKYEKMKQEKLLQKQLKQDEKSDSEPEEKPEEISQQEPKLDQIKDEKIRVPGYSQEFSKKAIELNRAFIDPQKRKFIPTVERQIVHNDKVLEYQAKPNEKIYKNADGVIITDEVLKMFGGNIDPSKIKIGYKAKQQQQSTYDPFSKVTEQMNFDYIKNLQNQKDPQPLEPTVEELPKQKIFLPDEEKPIQPDVIIKESTVKKCKIDLTKQSTPFVPLHLQKKVQTTQISQPQPQQKPQTQITDRQSEFRSMLIQQPQKPEDAFNDFMKDLQKL